jgi:hypothetical protein
MKYGKPHVTNIPIGGIMVCIQLPYTTYHVGYETLEEAVADKRHALKHCAKCDSETATCLA